MINNFKYGEGDLVQCVSITKENHEDLILNARYHVAGASNNFGDIIYALLDEGGKVHYSMDRFVLLQKSDLKSISLNPIKDADIYCVDPINACEPVEDIKTFDVVANPSHYTNRKFEVIDYIEDNMSFEGMNGWLEGNIIKYISRYKSKNGVQDLKKAQFYLNKLIGRLEE